MQVIKRNNLRKEVLDRIYQVDGGETTLRDFLNVNFYRRDLNYRDVSKITSNEAKRVIDLELGESTFIGIVEIKRIS